MESLLQSPWNEVAKREIIGEGMNAYAPSICLGALILDLNDFPAREGRSTLLRVRYFARAEVPSNVRACRPARAVVVRMTVYIASIAIQTTGANQPKTVNERCIRAYARVATT